MKTRKDYGHRDGQLLTFKSDKNDFNWLKFVEIITKSKLSRFIVHRL